MSDEEDLVRAVESARFTPTPGSGYDMGEVDLLLDVVDAALKNGERVRPLVEAATFHRVGVGKGYDEGEVDRFLDTVAAEDDLLRDAAAPASGPPAGDPPTELAAGQPTVLPADPPAVSVIDERRGVLRRLFRR